MEQTGTEDYLRYLEEHGRKDTTIRGYRMSLSAVRGILEDSGRDMDPEKATSKEYIMIRTAPGIRETTRFNYARIFAGYVKWATGKDIAKDADMYSSRPQPTTRRWINDDEFRRMWNIADPFERVILAFGGFMGLRRAEIAGARWDDMSGGRIIVRGKGHGREGKIVSMLIPEAVRKALGAWRKEAPDDPYILSAYDANGRMRRHGPDAIGKRFRALATRAGIDATTHSLRRLFACDLDAREVGPVQIAQLMRHESIATTYQCYLRPNQARLDSIAAAMGAGYRTALVGLNIKTCIHYMTQPKRFGTGPFGIY